MSAKETVNRILSRFFHPVCDAADAPQQTDEQLDAFLNEKGVQMQTGSDGNMTFSFSFKYNPRKYDSLIVPKSDDQKKQDESETSDDTDASYNPLQDNGDAPADKSSAPNSPSQDAAITLDDGLPTTSSASRQCALSFEDCRARNRYTCRYHGQQLIKGDILRLLEQQGITHAQVDITPQGHAGTLGAKVTCLNNPAEIRRAKRAIQAFLSMPGVGDSLEADYNRQNRAVETFFDVDNLNAEASSETNAHAEENPPREQPTENPETETHSEQPAETAEAETEQSHERPEPSEQPQPSEQPSSTSSAPADTSTAGEAVTSQSSPTQQDIDRAMQEQPAPLPEQNEDNQNNQNGEADASITLPTPVTPPVDYRMPPLNRLRRDQITAEYLGKLSEEVLRAYRYSFRRLADDWSVSGGLKKVLENPGDYDSLIENLARRGGRFSDRFMKTLEVLHPNYRNETIERQRRAREEAERRAREAERYAQELAGEVPTSVLSDEQRKQYVEKAIQLYPLYEDIFRGKLDGAMSPEGEPATNDLVRLLVCRLTDYDDPLSKAVARNLIAACNFAHPEKKILTNEEVNKTRAEIPAQVHAQDMTLATEAHVDYLGNRRKAPHGRAGACNCWVNANCQAAQFRGFDMSPIYDGGSSHGEWFENCKLEMSKAYERVSQGSVEDTERWLEENDSRIPDGSHISAWSGGHNVCYHKISGRWYKYDGFYEEFGEVCSFQEMAHCMWNYPDGSDFTTGCNYVSDKERQERIFSLQAQREIRNEARANGTEPDLSQENILRRAKNLFWRSQGSYLIRPDQPLLKVMFRSAEQNPNHYGAAT